MVTACQDGKYITRNISQFKVIDSSLKESDQEEEDEDDLSNDDTETPSVNQPVPPGPPANPARHDNLARHANPARRSDRSRNPPQRYGSLIYYSRK